MNVLGYELALLEVGFFFMISYWFKLYFELSVCNLMSYYWLMFTILTGFWEFFYIIHRKEVYLYSKILLDNRTHVWNQKYHIKNLLPHKFSLIFYSEYACYADKQYMNLRNNWSLIIEGTHCDLCALISLVSLFTLLNGYKEFYTILVCISMSCQLMNSILYMSEYNIQTKTICNLNYDSDEFPKGFMLCKRPFMWINIFWTFMPMYVLSNIIINLY